MQISRNKILNSKDQNGKVSLLMIFSLQLDNGIVINDLFLKKFNSSGNYIVQSINRSYTKKDGSKKYYELIYFPKEVQDQVLKLAIEVYKNGTNTIKTVTNAVNNSSNNSLDDDIMI